MGHFHKSMDDNLYEAKESQVPCSNVLEIKMAELVKTKNELKQAKDEATQSWLDSKPLIDKLEKLQTDLSNEKSQATKSINDILELKSQLQNTIISIQTKKEDEVKLKGTINQINQSLDETRKEMEQFKLETDEEHKVRTRLAQVLLLRRQTLQTLQLTIRATQIDLEAFSTSSANAFQQIKCSKTDKDIIQLTQEEYDELANSAQEQTSIADWRVSVAMEERFSAEKSRKLAQKRSQTQYRNNKSTETRRNDETTSNENIVRQEDDSRIKMRDHGNGNGNSRQTNFPKARAKLMAKNQRNSKQFDRSTSNSKIRVQQKKPSILVRIRDCAVHKITLWFG